MAHVLMQNGLHKLTIRKKNCTEVQLSTEKINDQNHLHRPGTQTYQPRRFFQCPGIHRLLRPGAFAQ